MKEFHYVLSSYTNVQFLKVLPDDCDTMDTKLTAFGNALQGSCLAHQLLNQNLMEQLSALRNEFVYGFM